MTPAPTLVDIGLNLAHDSFDHDRAEVVAAALASGVRHMVITGSTLDSTRVASRKAGRSAAAVAAAVTGAAFMAMTSCPLMRERSQGKLNVSRSPRRRRIPP